MRILHLINSPQLRGAEQFAARLADRLEQLGAENAICSLYPPSEADSRYDFGEIQSYELNVKRTVLDRIFRIEPSGVRRVLKTVRDFDPDIIVGHGTDTLKYASVAKLARRRVKTVYMNIGLASYWAASRGKRWFNRFWLRRIDRVVSVSELSRRDFIQHYGYDEERVHFIPNAVDSSAFRIADSPDTRTATRSELHLADDDVAICSIGRLSHEKGQDTLIRAIARLIESELPVKLVLVGDGPERAALEDLAGELGISGRISFLGLRDDVPAVLAGMDIYALSSRSEGMPGVLIEAGMAGLPSVSFDVGGAREVVLDGETGVIVPEGDLDELVNGLEGLVNRPGWRGELGARARTWCRSTYDLEIVAGQFERLFKDMLNGASAAPSVNAADAD